MHTKFSTNLLVYNGNGIVQLFCNFLMLAYYKFHKGVKRITQKLICIVYPFDILFFKNAKIEPFIEVNN